MDSLTLSPFLIATLRTSFDALRKEVEVYQWII
jgi:hypothetical protein